MQKNIFIVDDNVTNLSAAKNALKDLHRVRTLPSAAKMFEMMEKVTPDLILLDIEMPEMDGFQALERLKAEDKTAHIPVIFLTSLTDATVEARGFKMGVIDFINKPFSEPVLQNRIKTHLDIDEIIRERTQQLEQRTEELQKKTVLLESLQNALVFTLADMVENRDKETGGHIERTTSYIAILISEMIHRGVYLDELDKMSIEVVISSARLHDVGKIAIPDSILNKAGKLTDEEYEVMKSHCNSGERIIENIISRTEDMEFLQNAKLIAGSHHERWDGKGYPKGLAGEAIPIQGRIAALVDVYDALVSERSYKKAFTSEKAIEIMMQNAGSQFDPKIADVFFKSREKFEAIRR